MEPGERSEPLVSLVTVVSANRGYDSVFETLASLMPQRGDVTFEVLVVDKDDPQRRARYSQLPWVQVLWTQHPVSIPHGRRLAIQRARGRFIGFFDDHIRFYPDHMLGIGRCIEGGARLFGGPVENANPQTRASWAHYFCEYSKWLPIVPEGEMHDLPGSNFVVDASLLRCGGLQDESAGEFGLETLQFDRWRRLGVRAEYVHDVRIRHLHVEDITVFWRHVAFRYGMRFAASRGFGVGRRIVYALASPVTTCVLYLRVLRIVRRDRAYLGRFLSCSPALLATFAIRAAGEAVGYLCGRGQLARRIAPHDAEEPVNAA